jgi:hypothetical protein
MPRLLWIAPLVAGPLLHAQESGGTENVPEPVRRELLDLRARLDALEGRPAPPVEPEPVDLSDDELSSLPAANSNHVLSRRWFENIDLSGFAAVTYLDTGGTGTNRHGSFLLKEATLFLEAEVWEHASLFTEIWLQRYLYGDRFSANELHFRLDGLFAGENGRGLGLKVGRFELPFGEEYLRWDAHETPLIVFSAADPYGVDEGLELFGAAGPVGWIASLSTGTFGNGADDAAGKLVAAKLYGDVGSDLYLSGSVLSSGKTAQSALTLSGNAITPVGAAGSSTLGASPSDEVAALCWEVDARIAAKRCANLYLGLGRASIDDDAEAFDRELTWFLLEPAVRLTDEVELVLRYSAIGTFDDDEGYLFRGKIAAEGEDLGYDARSLRRLAAGARWTVNPHVAAKLEVGHDWFDLIDASPLDDENDERLYFGVELVASF